MMPGLLPNSLSGLSATPTSRATHRGPFPKPFTERIHNDSDASAAHPFGVNAVRVFHMPALQALRVQSRLNPVIEIAKLGVYCADRCTRMMSECGSSRCADPDPSSVCLDAMVNEFMESESACSGDSCEEAMRPIEISKSLQSLTRCRGDLEIKLLKDVQVIVESSEENHQSGCVHMDRKHMVMDALQRMGYDAAICKTRWDHSSDLPGGDYEYIDVLFALDAPMEPFRLLVDIDFQAQFVIARPSSEFSEVLQLVHPIFVGRPERLQQIVHLMAVATKQSLCIKGLHLAPWRKLNYMKAKWFSAYKRISNNVGSSSRKEGNDPINGGGFAGIAVRGYGLDPRCVSELGLLYQGSKLPRGRDGKDAISKAKGELITVTMTKWQPPPLEVRSHTNTRSQSNVTGLASMLRHAGLPTCNEVVAKAA